MLGKYLRARIPGGESARRLLLAIGCCLSLLAVPAAASANPNDVSTGSAFDIGVKSSLLNTFVTIGPAVGPITSNTTTDTKQSAVSISTAVASATVLSAEVATRNEFSSATATIASVAVALPGAPVIQATVLSSNSQSSCRLGHLVTGGQTIGTVVINGTSYNLASTPPNTVIPLGLASVTLNERIPLSHGLTVNAIDVRTVLGTRAIVASATSGMSGCVFGG